MEVGQMKTLNHSTLNTSVSKEVKSSSSYNGRIVWIACQAGLSTMTAILLYICICLVWFVNIQQNTRRIANWNNSDMAKHKDMQSSRRGGDVSIGSRKLRFRGLMRYACLFAAISTLLKFLVDQVKFFHAWNARSDFVCEIIYDITDIAIFAMAYIGVYSFLWIKQWLFYCDPVAVKFFYSRCLVMFSRVVVGVVVTASLGVAIVNWIPTRYRASNSIATNPKELAMDVSYIGCVAVYDMSDPAVQWPLLTYAALNAAFQITLLSLFIYPLALSKLKKWKNSKNQVLSQERAHDSFSSVSAVFAKNSPTPKRKHGHYDNVSTDSKSSYVTVGRRHFHDSDQLLSEDALRSIRRTIFWTTVCIVTDVSLVAGFAMISVGTPQILIAVATDFDLLMNIICILATYTTWREILFPMCTKKKVETTSTAHFSSRDAA